MGFAGNYNTRKMKRSLSLHQKQIRFFIGLSIVVCFLAVVLFFWLLNWSSLTLR